MFPYAGGKTKAIGILDQVLFRRFPDAKVLYSPFLGGGSFELHCLNQRGMTVYGNDLFTPVFYYWFAMQNDRDKLEHALNQPSVLTRDEYHKKLPLVANCEDTEGHYCDKAALFYRILKASFNNQMGRFSRTHALRPVRFKAVNLDNLNFTLSNLDVADFLSHHPEAGMSPESVLYLDPPYRATENRQYGVNGSMQRDFDHEALRDLLSKRLFWMLSYNDTPYVRALYKEHKMEPVGWRYSAGNTYGEELLIFSTRTRPYSWEAPFHAEMKRIDAESEAELKRMKAEFEAGIKRLERDAEDVVL